MKIFGGLLVLLSGLSFALPYARWSLPFRVPLTNTEALEAAVILAILGMIVLITAQD